MLNWFGTVSSVSVEKPYICNTQCFGAFFCRCSWQLQAVGLKSRDFFMKLQRWGGPSPFPGSADAWAPCCGVRRWHPSCGGSCPPAVTSGSPAARPRAVGHRADGSSATGEKYVWPAQETALCCLFIHKASDVARELVLMRGNTVLLN